MSEYKSTSHCKYLCRYHIIFCLKFRYSVLKGDVETILKEILVDAANRYEYEIIQTVASIDIVRVFKSITAIELFRNYPKLKSFYSRCDSLWSVGKFISTIGNVSAETIKQYIAEQKGK